MLDLEELGYPPQGSPFSHHPVCRGAQQRVLMILTMARAPPARRFLGIGLTEIPCEVLWILATQTDGILKPEPLASC